MKNKLREIRVQLRLAMNGVIAASMREKGMKYKLNFGVPIPEIRLIARQHAPDAALAEALWKEDIREFKILATLLQPADTFSLEQALQWVEEIPYPEIAEQACRNLFSKIPQAEALAACLLSEKESAYARTVAFLIGAHRWAEGSPFRVDGEPEEPASPMSAAPDFLDECIRSLKDPSVAWKEKQAALWALKCYGRRSAPQAEDILRRVSGWTLSDQSGLQEFYNDLKFEFEYYR